MGSRATAAPQPWRDLRLRAITVAVAFPALYLLLSVPLAFVGVCLLVIFAAGWEYAGIVTDTGFRPVAKSVGRPKAMLNAQRAVFGITTAAVAAAFLCFMRSDRKALANAQLELGPADFALVLALGIPAVLLAIAIIWSARRALTPAGGRRLWLTATGVAVRGLVWFGVFPACLALLLLRDTVAGRGWVLLVLAASWGSDIGGYLVGRAWGRHRPVPHISPAKTVEGYLGGLALASLLLTALGVGGVVERPLSEVLFIGVPATLLAMLGDLAESRLKRRHGTIDSGRLLPGHGGILDCIDGLCFAAPWVLGFSTSSR